MSSLRGKRHNIMFHFKAPSPKTNATDADDNGGSILGLAIEDYDDWVVDHDSYEMNQTNERYLSHYAMGKLWVKEDKTKLLLIVKVDEDNDMFEGKASKLDSLQNISHAKISGKEYYRLKCTITDGNRDLLVNGIQNKQYPLP